MNNTTSDVRAAHAAIDHLADTIVGSLEAWQEADTAVRDAHRALASAPGDDPDAWERLVALRDRRDQLARTLGNALGRWTALGGEVDLADPPSDAPGAPPEPAADTPVAAPATIEEPEEAEPTEVAPVPVAAPAPAPPPAPVPAPPATSVSPVAAVPPRRPQPKATPAALARLKAVGIGGAREEARKRADAHLRALVDQLDAPLTTDAPASIDAWLDHLSSLKPLPKLQIRGALARLAARLRGLQDREPSETVGTLLRRLRREVGDHDIGFVYGLAQDHKPQRGDWDADASPPTRAKAGKRNQETAEEALNRLQGLDLAALASDELRAVTAQALRSALRPDDKRLVALLADRVHDLKGDGALKQVRKAILKAARAKASAPKRPDGAPDADWPLWHMTRGKTAVIVGGDPRARNRDQIRDAFGFARLEWPEHDNTYLQRLKQRAEQGTVDVIIIIRFAKHIVDDTVLDPIRSDTTRWVRIDHGYGVAKIRRCMERHWAAHVAACDAS